MISIVFIGQKFSGHRFILGQNFKNNKAFVNNSLRLLHFQVSWMYQSMEHYGIHMSLLQKDLANAVSSMSDKNAAQEEEEGISTANIFNTKKPKDAMSGAADVRRVYVNSCACRAPHSPCRRDSGTS